MPGIFLWRCLGAVWSLRDGEARHPGPHHPISAVVLHGILGLIEMTIGQSFVHRPLYPQPAPFQLIREGFKFQM